MDTDEFSEIYGLLGESSAEFNKIVKDLILDSREFPEFSQNYSKEIDEKASNITFEILSILTKPDEM